MVNWIGLEGSDWFGLTVSFALDWTGSDRIRVVWIGIDYSGFEWIKYRPVRSAILRFVASEVCFHIRYSSIVQGVSIVRNEMAE